MADPQPSPAPQPAPQDAPPPEPQKDPLEARIEELLGAQQALTQKVQTQESLGDELRALFTGLTQKIDALSGGRPEPTRQPQPPTTHGAPQPTGQAADLQRLVQDAVAQALTPLTEGAARTDRHKQSYAKIAQQHPAFADPSSKAAQIFNKIYTTRADLRGLDDAPVVIAGLVRDILAGDRASQQVDTDRRTRASIPLGVGRREAPAAQGDVDVQQLKNRFLQLHEKGSKVPLSTREQGDYLNLQVALRSFGVL